MKLGFQEDYGLLDHSGARCLSRFIARTLRRYQPSFKGGKKWSGEVKKSWIFFLEDDTIPGDGQVKNSLPPPPPPFFPPVKISKILKTLDTRQKNMKISENAKYTSKNCYRTWKLWKCSLFSDLKTLEVLTIFRSEHLGSVQYFRIWKPWKCSLWVDPGSVCYFQIWIPWKCSLFSDPKTMEVFTTLGSVNRESVHYFLIRK